MIDSSLIMLCASIVLMKNLARSLGIAVLTALFAQAQTPAPRPPQTAARRLSLRLDDINHLVLEMANDFPAEKYGFRLTPEMLSFGELMVHIASGNAYAGKAGMGEIVKWDEFDAKNYKTKADIVALMTKTIAGAAAAIQANPEGPTKNLEPFLTVMEHSAEHYGELIAYYRVNGLVPPELRTKK
jgi:hypothetical protein